jgi:hypothetical protein
MRATSFIFKVAAIVLAVAAVVCAVLANLERITDWALTLREQLATKCSPPCDCGDYDEYEDWDI